MTLCAIRKTIFNYGVLNGAAPSKREHTRLLLVDAKRSFRSVKAIRRQQVLCHVPSYVTCPKCRNALDAMNPQDRVRARIHGR